jgi:tetratricopeptide (TPR) repeat protein
MTKQFAIFILLAITVTICASPVLAQSGTIKGVCKDAQGNLVVDGVVVWANPQTGQKYTLKTNRMGQYFSLGIAPAIYNVTLYKNASDAQSNREMSHINGVQVLVDENVLNFDEGSTSQQAGKAAVAQAGNPALSTENDKIRYLNSQLSLAQKARNERNFDQSASILNSALTVDPKQDLLWVQLGESYRLSGDYAKAIRAYQKAIEIKPTMGAYHNNLADAYYKGKRIDDAVSEYAIAAQVDSSGAASYIFNIGAVLTNSGRVQEAISAFTLAIKLDPTKADAYYQKGVNLLGLSTIGSNGVMTSPKGTRATFQRYLELSPFGQNAESAKKMLGSLGAESSGSAPDDGVFTQAFNAATPYNSRGDYKAGMDAEIAEFRKYNTIPVWSQKASDFWADPTIVSALQQQSAGEGQAQAQTQTPPPPQCNTLNQVIEIDDASGLASGPGHCNGEADFWFTNTSSQAIDCAIIFHKGGRFDPASVVNFTLSPGGKSGGPGKISTCGFGQRADDVSVFLSRRKYCGGLYGPDPVVTIGAFSRPKGPCPCVQLCGGGSKPEPFLAVLRE